jgi:hypothetical protein
MPAVATTMTVEEFLALPDDGAERWLIDGALREKPMHVRRAAEKDILNEVAVTATPVPLEWHCKGADDRDRCKPPRRADSWFEMPSAIRP